MEHQRGAAHWVEEAWNASYIVVGQYICPNQNGFTFQAQVSIPVDTISPSIQGVINLLGFFNQQFIEWYPNGSEFIFN